MKMYKKNNDSRITYIHRELSDSEKESGTQKSERKSSFVKTGYRRHILQI